MYLKDHPAYIGQVKSHRFIYEVESWETDPVSGVNKKVVKKAERNTSCIALDYGMIEAMGIDLQRFKNAGQMLFDVPASNQEPEKMSVPKTAGDELPF